MEDMRLGLVEARFADIVWEHAPLTSKELVALCAQPPLNWKRTTTYTVLKKLCLRGIFSLDDGLVTVKITKDRFRTLQSEQFVDRNFSGSLPAFVAAFSAGKPLSREELAQLRQLLDTYEGSK